MCSAFPRIEAQGSRAEQRALMKREKNIREIMTTDVVTLMLDDTLRLADDLMNLANLHHFPVVEGGRVVGIVSRLDLILASLTSVTQRGVRSPREVLGTIAVKDVMKEVPATISPDMTVREAARLMVEKRIDCLVVVEGGSLVGIATRTDLLAEMVRM